MQSHVFPMVAIMLMAAGATAQNLPKPVALVGSAYGRYEVASVIRNAINVSPDLEYVYEDRGSGLPAAEFAKYSLVVMATSVDRPLSAAEAPLVEQYLRNGGHLLLINRVTISWLKDLEPEQTAWLGLQDVPWFRRAMPAGAILLPEHPFLQNALAPTAQPDWFTYNTRGVPAAPDFENVIGTTEGHCLLGRRRVGQGWVAFLAPEFFRIKFKMPPADADAYAALLRNIVAAAAPLTNGRRRERSVTEHLAAGRQILLWTREWTKGEEYGPRFSPPLPEAAELVSELAADMAVDESETLQLNVTPLAEFGDAVCRLPGTAGFPAANIEVFVQDRPDPIPWPKNPEIAREFPHWLMPPDRVAPKGRPAFTAPAAQTRILWLKLNTSGVKPGAYTLSCEVQFERGPTLRIPVTVRVYPIRLPRRRLIVWQAAGQIYGDVNNPKPAQRFAENLESHGIEWSLINTIRPGVLGLVGETGNLAQLLPQMQERFAAGDRPQVDFSAFDEWMAQAIGCGLTRFSVGGVGTALNGVLKKADYGDETATAVRHWFAQELARYLREKGVRYMVTSYGDELNEKELKENFLPWAQPLTEAGWACTSSFTGFQHVRPDFNELLYPYVGLWTLNRSMMPAFVTRLRAGEIKVRPDAVIGTYGAGEGRGSEHRKPRTHGRFLGWESWMWGVGNCATNPYFKGWLYYCSYDNRDQGIAGERWVSYLDRDDFDAPLANCPFLEGIREGMEDGNLAAILSWYLEALAGTGAAAETVTTARTRLATVLGNTPDAILRWDAPPRQDGLPALPRIQGGPAAFARAKREVLDILDLMRPAALRGIRPTLYWNDVPLARAGQPVAAVYTGTIAAADLAAAMLDIGGVAIPVHAGADTIDPDLETAVVIGTGTQNPLLQSDLAGVRPGSYIIRELPAAEGRPRTLLIAGPDAEGTRKGMRLFAEFLRAEGNWFVP